MEKFKCIKVVEAEPQKLTEEMAKRFEGTSSKVGDDGYKVVYSDGFESWSPKDVFEKGYIPEPKDYQERMIQEYSELLAKVVKLGEILKNDDFKKKIGPEKTFLMEEQLKAMILYSDILFHRMELEGIEFECVEEK